MSTGFGKGRERRWRPAIGAFVALGLAAGGAAVLLSHHPAPAGRPLADTCGLVQCQASLPAAVSASASSGRRAAHATRRPATPAPVHRRQPRPSPKPSGSSPSPRPTATPSPSPSPTPSPSPSPTPGPDVTVSYAVQHHHDGPGKQFQGLLTITNLGGEPVANWQLQLSFPGDSITWVGPAGGYSPFDVWSFSGGSLVLNAAATGETVPVGGSAQIVIYAQGPTAKPTSCAFDGVTCTP